MEASSPLASLQPNHPARFPAAGHQYARPTNFNFKDMSMFNPRPDYFNIKPVRGSSPTASLAADLSQNFHIDQSPQLPTPRRNLFNGPSTGFGAHPATPPVPSSSPGLDVAMDMSPLPHKPLSASASVSNINVNLSTVLDPNLPTPEPTPVDDVPMSLNKDLNIPRPQSARPTFGHQRRISSGTRQGLRKGISVAGLSRASLEAPFVFGSTSAAPPPILESFADSPPSERKPLGAVAATGAVPRLVYPETTSQAGSPVGPLRRMSASRVGGPRIGLSRRTQSMQYSAGRPMRQEKRCCTEGNWQPSVDLHETRSLRLPHFRSEDEVDALPRITPSTLVDIRNGQHAADVGQVTIIDCRFEYEFEGGHIPGAVNFNDKESLASLLFSDASSSVTGAHTGTATGTAETTQEHTLIFHCEYSNHRAPIMAKFIRQRDRFMNSHRYPHLTYPEIYIVDGGYSTFYKEFRDLCEPQNYVEMDAKEHEDACERGMAKVKRRAKLSRAQTYAFGQSSAAPPAPPLPSMSTLPPFSSVSAFASVPELPAFSSPKLDLDSSPGGMAMDLDSPMPMPRAARRNDSY